MAEYSNSSLNSVSQPKSRRKKKVENDKFPLSPPPYLGTDSGLYSEILLRFQVLYLRFFFNFYLQCRVFPTDITHRILSVMRGERAV